ncbi:hypothetical protein C7B82_26780 [Stenomitos frigidus ULC18]|uniref:Uncharacterized protein n=2 Tax=Stenomitos TaxID=1844270 RepID=A0A2T1DVT3_9CYAN|nr:hypothetical protein C7B82_26780 [Stenomitos frigidus ULC18]
MVQELEQFYLSTPEAIPVFFRTYTCSGDRVISKELCSLLNEKVCSTLGDKLYLLRKYAPELSKIDPFTEKITNSLEHYANGIIFERLEYGSLRVNSADRTLSLSLEIVVKMAEAVPKRFSSDRPQQWLRMACLVFLLHEVSHIAQKLAEYEDVQRMKEVDVRIGRERIGELDLRSDYLVVHTLSLFLMFHDERAYNHRKYIRWFYELWCGVCRAMLDVFPNDGREDKQQRIFGYLLMSKLIRDAHLSNYPLEFNGELWPVWNPSLDGLSIYSQGEPFISGCPVDSALMKQILEDISTSNYGRALPKIDELWKCLPRR